MIRSNECQPKCCQGPQKTGPEIQSAACGSSEHASSDERYRHHQQQHTIKQAQTATRASIRATAAAAAAADADDVNMSSLKKDACVPMMSCQRDRATDRAIAAAMATAMATAAAAAAAASRVQRFSSSSSSLSRSLLRVAFYLSITRKEKVRNW